MVKMLSNQMQIGVRIYSFKDDQARFDLPEERIFEDESEVLVWKKKLLVVDLTGISRGEVKSISAAVDRNIQSLINRLPLKLQSITFGKGVIRNCLPVIAKVHGERILKRENKVSVHLQSQIFKL